MEAYDRIVSSDCSGDSCNNANSWLRIRTNVRRNIHEKCPSGRPALFVKTSVNSFVTAPRQRWCSIPFMIPSASQFKEKLTSQNGFFTLGHCCSSPWLIAQCPLSCGLSSFYSPFSLVRPVGVNKTLMGGEWSLRRNSSNFRISSCAQSYFPALLPCSDLPLSIL